MAKELKGLEEGPKTGIHIDLLRMTQKIANWKTPGYDGIHRFWFNKFTTIYDRLALEMIRCQQKAHVPECMTKGRTTLIRKDSRKRTALNNYRHITCYDVENTHGTNKGRDLFLANKPRIVPWGTEWMLQKVQMHRRITLSWSANPQREQDETEKSIHDFDWQRKDLWYGPANLDNKLSQNVQNIRWSHEHYRENHENLAEAKIQKGIFSGDALLPLLFIMTMLPLNHILRKCNTGCKLTKSQGNINHDIKQFVKN